MSESIEQIRARYRPGQIRTLFVGESPPAEGAFFYSGGTLMDNYFAQAFGKPDNFLGWFKSQGFYLDDLALEPINTKTAPEKRMQHRAAVPGMAQRLVQYEPQAVVIVMKGIEQAVRMAIAESGISVPTYTVPFPGNGQQVRFLEEMAKIIPELPSNESIA